MAALNFRLSRRAISDLEEISEYLGKRSITAADRVIDELTLTFEALAKNRGIGSDLDDLKAGLRVFVPAKPAEKYLVFYYQVPGGVMISDIIHSARDWTAMFESGER
jgi:plasmid stabilization system protein ParE